MEGIQIVLVLVRCSADLLLCDVIATEHPNFATMDHCRVEASWQLTAREAAADPDVWMARCRYILPRREAPGDDAVTPARDGPLSMLSAPGH